MRQALADAADLVCGDRASEPFELEIAGRRRLDKLLYGREEALADQDLSRCSLGAEARSEVRHGPEDAVVVTRLKADAPDRRVAGFDPDTEPELYSALTPDLG